MDCIIKVTNARNNKTQKIFETNVVKANKTTSKEQGTGTLVSLRPHIREPLRSVDNETKRRNKNTNKKRGQKPNNSLKIFEN